MRIIRTTKILNFQWEVTMTTGKLIIMATKIGIKTNKFYTHNKGVPEEKEDINTSLQHPHLGHNYHLNEVWLSPWYNFQR